MIVLIAAVTAPYHLNGVSRHALNLCHALLEEPGISKIHFLVGDWQISMLSESAITADARLRVHAVSLANNSAGRLWWYLSDLPLVAAQLEVDMVHLACPAPLRAARFHCPVVLSLHDMYPFEISRNFGIVKGWLARLIVRRAIREASAIACVSESTRAALSVYNRAASGKARTINNIVKPLAYASRCPFGLQSGFQFVLCVAQHRANKNVPLALRIHKEALSKKILCSRAVLVVVGICGPETRAIRRTIDQLGLAKNVLLIEGMHDAELQWCYQHCVALLAPSITEGFGLPVAEALMAGCPVICSDIPAFREIANQDCRLIPADCNAVEAYCARLHDVLVQPRPRPRPLPEFSPRFIGAQYFHLYRKIACQPNQRFAMLAKPDSPVRRPPYVGRSR